MVEVKMALNIPKPPNFLRYGDGESTVSIADLTDADLRQVGKLWTDGLLRRAAEIRAQASTGTSP